MKKLFFFVMALLCLVSTYAQNNQDLEAQVANALSQLDVSNLSTGNYTDKNHHQT